MLRPQITSSVYLIQGESVVVNLIGPSIRPIENIVRKELQQKIIEPHALARE
jgi:hypothetical protein